MALKTLWVYDSCSFVKDYGLFHLLIKHSRTATAGQRGLSVKIPAIHRLAQQLLWGFLSCNKL